LIENFAIAIILSLAAGLSTALGGLISIFFKKPGPNFISLTMGFSAGVMIFISFVELLQEGINYFGILFGSTFFFIGIGIMFLLDIFVSNSLHFDEKFLEYEESKKDKYNMKKTSFLVLISVFLHNLPEGIATMVGSLKNLELGVLLAFAIALHNIPEGIAVAIPIYATKKSRKKAILWSLFSGISEPIGAILFGTILIPFIDDYILSAILAMVGGIMIYVSIDELLPVSHVYGHEHVSIMGIVFGMIIMAISLSFF
jgi:ZIP family zinc transporter